MPTHTNIAQEKIVGIQYRVDKPTLEQIVAISTITFRLGAVATMFMIQAATRCAGGVFYEQTTIAELAQQLGLSNMHSKMNKTLQRLERFGCIEREPDGSIIIDRWPSYTET
jgi:hypothetical protein